MKRRKRGRMDDGEKGKKKGREEKENVNLGNGKKGWRSEEVKEREKMLE